MYWGLTALDLMGKLEQADKQRVLEFIGQCQSDCGGISASMEHDPHLLYTLSAIQILCIYDALDVIDVEKVVKYVKERQQLDGSFTGDYWGEVDVRFSFCAVATLSLLVTIACRALLAAVLRYWRASCVKNSFFQNRLDAIDIEKAVEFILKCMNFDGAFGSKPGSESHAGLIYCCVGLLSITGNATCASHVTIIPELQKYFNSKFEIFFSPAKSRSR